MTNYSKSMMEALVEVRGLQENNMDLVRKAASKGGMQTLKMKDGNLKMDKVTASAIIQVFDKLNSANQKKMEQMINDGKKSGIIKVSDFAMSKVTGFKSEEVEEDYVITVKGKEVSRHEKEDDARKEWHKLTKKHGTIDVKVTKEEVELDEGKEKAARQLVDPNKEVMVVKKNKVVVIDKKDQDKYLKQGWSLAEETELDEAPKYELYHKDFSTAMQYAYKMAKKLHGITVDPKEIDDKVASGPRKPSEGKTNSYRLEGDKGAIQVQVYNKGGSKPYELNFYKEDVDLDEKMKMITVTDGKETKRIQDTPDMRKIWIKKKGWTIVKEEVELDEGSTQVLAHGGKGQYKVVSGPAKDGSRETVVKFKGKVVSKGDYDSGADGWFMNIKGKKGQEFFDDAQKMADYFAKNKITEEIDLDEASRAPLKIDPKAYNEWLKKEIKKAEAAGKKELAAVMKTKFAKEEVGSSKTFKEYWEIGTDEYRDHCEKVTPGEDIKEKDVDPADVDDDATDDDRAAASKNIIHQLRKSIDQKGKFAVTFDDNKKVKVDAKIAQAVNDKFMAIKKPTDKEKFQSKIANSYKDMLKVLKNDYNHEETILDRIDRKLREKKELLETSNRWELGGKKFSLIDDNGTFILVPQGRPGKEQKLKAKTPQDATQELVKKGYKES